ncbi:MAG: APC family permease [Opitutus sp.]|nr:APC family permease [Opitutus sp.]
MSPDPTQPQLVRAIGRWTLTALVLNCIIASGIFGLPDDVARLVGPAAPWAYLMAAAGIAFIMAAFAEVSSQFREAGGPYLYAREAFGPLAGIQTAWFAWLTRVTASAAIANIFVGYLEEFWPGSTAPLPRALLLIGLLAVLTVVNIRGVRGGARLNNAITIAKLVPLAVFIVIGLVLAPRGTPTPLAAAPTLVNWIDALVVLLFAFGGFESSLMAAGETKDPRADAPFALLVGLVIVALIYLCAHIVAMWSLPGLATSERPLADAARVFAGDGGARMIAIGATLSTLGALCGGIVTAPRMIYALGERGDFPKIFAAVHPRYRTPYVSIIFWAVLVLGLALWGNFLWNAVLSVSARLVSYGMTCAALIQMRRRHPTAGAWRAPAGNWVALIGIAFCALLATSLTPTHAAIMAIVALVALINWRRVRRHANAVVPATP